MNIGLIFAMKEELEATINKMNFIKKHCIFELNIFECELNNKKCFLIESGIGKVNAARATQVIIDKMEIDYIINVGVAGSVSKDVKKCDIVIAKDLVQHDYDLTSFNREKGVIPNVGKYIKCDEKLLHIAQSVNINNRKVVGTIASGDIFVSEESMGKKINSKFNALCVEMEGAAIAQVCYLCNKPFIVIRSISDSPYDDNNNITFDEFLDISSQTVAEFVLQLIENI